MKSLHEYTTIFTKILSTSSLPILVCEVCKLVNNSSSYSPLWESLFVFEVCKLVNNSSSYSPLRESLSVIQELETRL